MKLVKKSLDLNPNDILRAEFEYAAQTAFQSNEDRVNIYSYYFTSVVSTIGAIALVGTLDLELKIFIVLLLLGVWFVGVISAIKIIKLRLAWFGSVKTMISIKELYKGEHEKLSTALRWDQTSLPNLNSTFSISFLIYLSLIVLSSIVLNSAVTILFFNVLESSIGFALLVGAFTSILYFASTIYLWKKLLVVSV